MLESSEGLAATWIASRLWADQITGPIREHYDSLHLLPSRSAAPLEIAFLMRDSRQKI